MKKDEAEKLINETFSDSYDETRFRKFIANIFNKYEVLDEGASTGRYIPEAFGDGVVSFKRLAKFIDPENMKIDVLAVKLKNKHCLENARTMQRNFIARYLNGSRNGVLKDAALVAFYTDDSKDWRFSLVRMDYVLDEEKQRINKELTPARRYSFLVGQTEKTHTAKKQLLPIIQSDVETILSDLEKAFNIETVTKEFFEKYKALYLSLKDALNNHIENDVNTKAEFEKKEVVIEDFAKRLLGQIVFLYFLQKKGWLGVKKGKDWGTGPKDFLQSLYRREIVKYENFFNDVLEPLFYEALATERTQHYYDKFECRIPFLNGGLFEAIKGYDWVNTDILLDNSIFKEIFEVFDLYNFTVREDEPLDKEVAVDPEMLGKVFENLIPENERKGSGTYYTPREIVHYMCQESLINYLDAKLNIESQPVEENIQPSLLPSLIKTDLLTKFKDVYVPVVSRDDLADFIYHGDVAREHDTTAQAKTQNEDYTGKYQHKIPESVRKYSKKIDDALASVKICDPAIGSGAFPVGVMNEIVRARSSLNAYLGDAGRSPYDLKRHAIQESIYGVDLEPSAVDIAKLRLWLSLIVDEEDFGTIKPLPNLDYKIVFGNSLIGFPFDTTGRAEKLRELTPLKEEFFNSFSPSHKAGLRDKINKIINSEYLNPQTEKSIGYKVNFDFRWSFFEVFDQNGGFDIVIANPPYAGERKQKEIFLDVQKANLSKFYLGRMDYFYFFFHLALEIGRKSAQFSFITTNYFITALGAKKLRDDLRKRATFNNLTNFNEFKIFDTAKGQHNIISIFSKGHVYNRNSNVNTAVVRNPEPASIVRLNSIIQKKDADTDYFQVSQNDLYEGEENYIRLNGKASLGSNPLQNIFAKMIEASRGVTLSDICNPIIGLESSADDVYVFDKEKLEEMSFTDLELEILKPFYKSSDISRYHFKSSPKQFILYLHEKMPNQINKMSGIWSYLNSHETRLKGRKGANLRGAFKRNNWWVLNTPRLSLDFEGPKIITPYRSKKCNFAYCDAPWYASRDVYYITQKQSDINLKYVLALLNSKLYYIWFYNKGKRKGEMLELYQKPLSEVPICIGSESLRINLTEIVDAILLYKSKDLFDSKAPNLEVLLLEEKIDQLVYQLFNLTSEEIAIVEDASK